MAEAKMTARKDSALEKAALALNRWANRTQLLTPVWSCNCSSCKIVRQFTAACAAHRKGKRK